MGSPALLAALFATAGFAKVFTFEKIAHGVASNETLSRGAWTWVGVFGIPKSQPDDSRECTMNRFRISRAALFCTIGVAASGVLRAQAEDLEKEVRKFKGDWILESSVASGVALPAAELKGLILTFEGNQHTLRKGDEVIQAGTQELDPSKSPKTIDVTIVEGPNKGAVMLGIYEIDGDTLKVCFDPQGKNRPTEFESAPGSANFVNVHRRMKK